PALDPPHGSRTRSPSNAIEGLRGSPKLVLHHLPGGVQRQPVEEFDVPRRLESGHPLTAPCHQILFGHRAFGMLKWHYKGLPYLTESLVGHTDHGDLSNRRVLQHEALDLGRMRIEPANDEHVLFTPVDLQPAGLVEIAQVAGVQAAVGVARLRGGLRVLQVALADAVAADQYLAVGGDPHFDVLAGQARGGGYVLEGVARS